MEGTLTGELRDEEGNLLERRDGIFLKVDVLDALFAGKRITGYRARAKALGLTGPSALHRFCRAEYPDPCTDQFIYAVRRHFPRISYSRVFVEREGVLCRARAAATADRAA